MKSINQENDTINYTNDGFVIRYLPENDIKINKINKIVNLGVNLITAILAIRELFLMFAANQVVATKILYAITYPFLLPFRGIFKTAGSEDVFFDTAIIVAIPIYYILGWIINRLSM